MAESMAYSRIWSKQPISSMLRYYGCFEYHGRCTLILEYASQGSLLSFMEQAHGPPRRDKDVWRLWERILDLVQALHRTHLAGIWHQDINPTNILICQAFIASTYNVVPKLADFGRSSPRCVNLQYPDDLTTRENYGTKAYGAPECWRENRYSKKTELHICQTADIWSLGALFLTIAVWMKHGMEGVRAFDTARLNEARVLKMESIACFHDREEILQSVRDEMNSFTGGQLVDQINAALCQNVIAPMLQAKPDDRPSAENLTKTIPRTISALKTKLDQSHTSVIETVPVSALPIPEAVSQIPNEYDSFEYFLDGQLLNKTVLSKKMSEHNTAVADAVFEGRRGYRITGVLLSEDVLEELCKRSRQHHLTSYPARFAASRMDG